MPFCRLASNNFLSEKFSIARDIRKGDHLFPTIFILCIEYLNNTLRDNPLLDGFKIGGLSGKYLCLQITH